MLATTKIQTLVETRLSGDDVFAVLDLEFQLLQNKEAMLEGFDSHDRNGLDRFAAWCSQQAVHEWMSSADKVLGRLERSRRSREAVMDTAQGRSLLFSKALCTAILDADASFCLVPVKEAEMITHSAALLRLQRIMKESGRTFQVTIGYHYTQACNVQGIEVRGLMSYETMLSSGNRSAQRRHGAYFENGIYCGLNPFAFQKYGSTGLIVAILRGRKKRTSAFKGKKHLPIF